MKELGMEHLMQYLIDANITFDCLKYMDRDDIKEAIPPLGPRLIFREKLFEWRKTFYEANENSVEPPLKQNEPVKIEEDQSINSRKSINYKDLKNLIMETSRGRQILNFYEANNCLTKEKRDILINIILEDAIATNVILKPFDMANITNDIVSIFPKEKEMMDYYFIPRSGKSNCGGKLFSKFKNRNHKRSKMEIQHVTQKPSLDQMSEVDVSVGNTLKGYLNRSSSNWEEIKDKWQKTFTMRQNDLRQMEWEEFFKSWSKLSHARAPELISIDFNIMYPSKSHLLLAKWDSFKTHIAAVYKKSLSNKCFKELFKRGESSFDPNIQDYIYTTLLTTLLPPSARFVNESGKQFKKTTIMDSQECFIIRADTHSDIDIKIAKIISKFYSVGMTVQPFLVVVGLADDCIKSFFVYFEKMLYKLDSFLDSLDICFQIFQVLNLKYPSACQQPWLFIQKYFYEISTEYDLKSPRIAHLLNELKNLSN
ncbi:uncharacterized protein [Drosophila takahashii]